MALSPFSDLSALAQALASRQIGAVELATAVLERIDADSTNSFLAVDPERTLAQARLAEDRLKQAAAPTGPGFSLVGLPIGQKTLSRSTGQVPQKLSIMTSLARPVKHP